MTSVPLTTYSGHERSPSFSPDGNQVAFSWDGARQDNFDIYVKVIGSDPPLPLTTHPAEDWGPAWSPDGRRIAFLRELGEKKAAVLVVPPIGGTERKIAEVHKPWSGFGSPITWSPDGTSLVVVDRRSTTEAYGLFVLSVESSEKRQLTSPPALVEGDFAPAFSPDGSAIAFSRIANEGSAQLYLLPVSSDLTASGEAKRLTLSRPQVNNPVWTPDGREIIFSDGLPSLAIGRFGKLWRVAVTGSDEPQPLAVGENSFGLSISWTRRRLVYSREVSDANIWRVEIPSPRTGTIPAQLIASTQQETNPQISPDGNRVVFSSNRSGAGEIWTCNADGANPVPLTSFGRLESASPRWSPDGRWIGFDSNIDGQWEVYVVNSQGGKPRRLTLHPALDANPSWSRDGKWIYFGSNRSGDLQVWKMPASGGEPSQVTQKGGSVPLESPDGKFVYYLKEKGDRIETRGAEVPHPAYDESVSLSGSGLHVWKVPSQGGNEDEVLGPILARDYDVAKDGIYFIPKSKSGKSQSIRFFSFATGKIETVASIDNAWGQYISVSPDGRWILYTKLDLEGSDLMLVENFR